jgi:hypothetical protein
VKYLPLDSNSLSDDKEIKVFSKYSLFNVVLNVIDFARDRAQF